MPSLSPSLRAATLVAVGATGAAVVLLGFASPAQATASPSLHFSTAHGDTTSGPVPAGICAITWKIIGGQGGAASDGTVGGAAGELRLTTLVQPAQVFALYPGSVGGDGGTSGGTSGTNGLNTDSAPGNDDGTGVFGGGGGADSAVTSAGGSDLTAPGGDGGGDGGGTGGGGGYGNVTVVGSVFFDQTDAAGGSHHTGAGLIEGDGVPCPAAPTNLSAEGGDGEATVYFSEDPSTDGDSWQYSLDGTTWTTVSTTGNDVKSFSLSGLTNGTTYTIRVRGVSSTVGAGPSAAVSVSPAVPNGAPTHVVVTPGASSYVVTWDAPATSGTFPVAGYVVGWSGGEMGGPLCEDVPVSAARRCVGAAVPGSSYAVSVWTVDTKGNWGDRSADVPVGTVAAPSVPAAPPASADKLTLPTGAKAAVSPGATMTLTGSGYLPNSTVSVIIYSSPQVLTSVITDATGSFTVTITVPKGLESGQHTLVASGVDPSGAVRYVTLPVTVSGGTTGSGGLAYTGFDAALPLTGGLIAVAVGVALTVLARRRKVAETTV